MINLIYIVYRSDGAEVCSGHGECMFGVCMCDAVTPDNPHQRYTGMYCEVNSDNCPYYNGLLCGGKYYISFWVTYVI